MRQEIEEILSFLFGSLNFLLLFICPIYPNLWLPSFSSLIYLTLKLLGGLPLCPGRNKIMLIIIVNIIPYIPFFNFL